LEVGFSLYYLNRCNRSGIPSGGLIGGLRQNGKWKMDARFPRNELIRRIEVIAAKRKAISVKNWDAERFILEYVSKLPRRTLVYCDPPYYNEANRLYLNHYEPKDHSRIAKTIQRYVTCPWLVSYDGVPQIMKHYVKRRSFHYELQYNAAKAYKGTEVFFLSDNLHLPTTSAVPCIEAALQHTSG
jgi:DNA adenine methylase